MWGNHDSKWGCKKNLKKIKCPTKKKVKIWIVINVLNNFFLRFLCNEKLLNFLVHINFLKLFCLVVCQVINVTFQNIDKNQLSRLLGNISGIYFKRFINFLFLRGQRSLTQDNFFLKMRFDVFSKSFAYLRYYNFLISNKINF